MSGCQAEINYVREILGKNLRIPSYQRPYKWSQKNVTELLDDIFESVLLRKESRYRVGTVILHQDKDVLYIVDGQQRLLTFILISMVLDAEFSCPLMEDVDFQKCLAIDKESQRNLHNNYQLVKERIGSCLEGERASLREALEKNLEFVVVHVLNQHEAFQLFDSQNTRGKRLHPHDLLKAYHLREIDDKYNMEHAVVRWEAVDSLKIRDLFNDYLYPIQSWLSNDKCGTFTEKHIDLFKGVSSDTRYTFGRRVIKSMPCYQLGELFEAGKDFFGMVGHYLNMRQDVEREVSTWCGVAELLKSGCSTGLSHARRLFLCALMCYYDRFANFDRLAIQKLCQWAFMIRVDMTHLGFDTINKYAIGEDMSGVYSNCIPMFKLIKSARSHHEISNLQIAVATVEDCDGMNDERKGVQKVLSSLNKAR